MDKERRHPILMLAQVTLKSWLSKGKLLTAEHSHFEFLTAILPQNRRGGMGGGKIAKWFF